MKQVLLTPLARRDLDEIWDYLAAEGSAGAERVIGAIEAAFAKLAAAPGMGHVREDLAERSYRFLLVYSYLIVYRAGTRPLQVVRVLHASRDVRALLEFPGEP
jgi:toxin ParE1/3/4